MKNFKLQILALSLFLGIGVSCTAPSGKEVLKKSIAFHDPDGQWHSLQQKLNLQSDFVYPDRLFYTLSIGLDNPNKRVSYANTTLAQRTDFTDTTCTVIIGNQTCAQTEWTKNFYHFILGLPMTLQNDEGIVHETVQQMTFHDTPCYQITVNFVKEKWHFYFSKTDYHLIGFAFNKNFESKAEEIQTDGILQIDALKLCKVRSWWITTDSLTPVYSGTDEIISSSSWVNKD